MDPEVLAPAGSRESLEAAVRCGAHAVYLGGRELNARAGAEGFGGEELAGAAAYCRVRGVKLFLALNTMVFDRELGKVERLLEEACAAGVDGLIVQDLGVAALARRLAPGLPLHASTQMSVHNPAGVRLLKELGFVRVVVARELSLGEIRRMAEECGGPDGLEIECFVHGALCMCVSGQCYLSAALGGRSGNRGRCAQPCRLPFSTGGQSHALSLRDLSLVERIGELARAGVKSLKIEGRLKRPEYVAAAVTACRKAIAGEKPDMETLEAVFSRGGFTAGYLDGRMGPGMFGTRAREDAASPKVLRDLESLYRGERGAVPVSAHLEAARGKPVKLVLEDSRGNRAEAAGDPPREADGPPTGEERIRVSIGKMGGTPFRLEGMDCALEEGLFLPAFQLNALRREALERMAALRAVPPPRPFRRIETRPEPTRPPPARPGLRVRLERGEQLVGIPADVEFVILSLEELERLPEEAFQAMRDRWIAELPRMVFQGGKELRHRLDKLKARGVNRALAGNLGSLRMAREAGMLVHGDFGLNIANREALAECQRLGMEDVTLSFEMGLPAVRALEGALPRGILAYGCLPLMITRNAPGGKAGSGELWLTDRKNQRFRARREPNRQAWALYNPVPLYLGDRGEEWRGVDFATLYFTREDPGECRAILDRFRNGEPWPQDRPMTRGLSRRGAL